MPWGSFMPRKSLLHGHWMGQRVLQVVGFHTRLVEHPTPLVPCPWWGLRGKGPMVAIPWGLCCPCDTLPYVGSRTRR